MTLSIGKQWGLRRLSDENGFFKMSSLDQRPPIEDPIKQHLDSSQNLFHEIVKFKRLLINGFQDKATAMLLDPSFAVAGCLDTLQTSKGLFISLEDPLSTKTDEGASLTSTIPHWSVAKIKRIGGDAVKLLIWYRPDGDEKVNSHQQELVKQVGAECTRYDIPFILELLAYPPSSYSETKESKRNCVLKSVQEFAQPGYMVDAFMVESPVEASQVPAIGEDGWQEVQASFKELAKLAARPWIMLSMGADMVQFHNIMTQAYEAGCSGYLAGRAYWLDTLSFYPDWKKMRLDVEGKPQRFIEELNSLTDRVATPWNSHSGYDFSQPEASPLENDFCKSYSGI